jgi:hypothetical protein
MPMWMRMMEVLKELSITWNHWRFLAFRFLTSRIVSLEEKWKKLRHYIAEKWVHFPRLCRMNGKRHGKLGLLSCWENLGA